MTGPVMVHIATNNLASFSQCGLPLQSSNKILAPFMKLDAYYRHWADRMDYVAPPAICPECREKADADRAPIGA